MRCSSSKVWTNLKRGLSRSYLFYLLFYYLFYIYLYSYFCTIYRHIFPPKWSDISWWTSYYYWAVCPFSLHHDTSPAAQQARAQRKHSILKTALEFQPFCNIAYQYKLLISSIRVYFGILVIQSVLWFFKGILVNYRKPFPTLT